MLSSQINFFALPEDYSDILQWLKERDIIHVKAYHSYLEDYMVNHFCVDHSLKFWEICLTLSKWVNSIDYEEFLMNDNTITYFMDKDKELVIEFSSDYMGMYDLLPVTRFYFTKQYYDSETRTFIKKDEEYIKWAMKFYRDFKKKFLVKYDFDPYLGVYATPALIEQYKQGNVKFRKE